ncbi:MAG: hypothetical protein ACOY71_09210 [Gemmatimonadota bacterium]
MREQLIGGGLLLAIAACSGAGAPPVPSVGPAADVEEQERTVSAVVEAALRATTQPAFDTLFATGAEILRDGRLVARPPFFAGVGDDGDVAITSSRVEVSPGFAWSTVEYRWISRDKGTAAEGVATFVVRRMNERAWRIIHAHSSSPRSP